MVQIAKARARTASRRCAGGPGAFLDQSGGARPGLGSCQVAAHEALGATEQEFEA